MLITLKNSNCDETQKLIEIKLKNSNRDETRKIKLWLNSKTEIVVKTQKLKL